MTNIPEDKKQQALDALRKTLGWCEQVGVVHTITNYDGKVSIEVYKVEYDPSNRTLMLKDRK